MCVFVFELQNFTHLFFDHVVGHFLFFVLFFLLGWRVAHSAPPDNRASQWKPPVSTNAASLAPALT
jgi:hypothetical protein